MGSSLQALFALASCRPDAAKTGSPSNGQFQRSFVEMVPRGYMFGTGAPRKRLDLVYLERAPKRGCLDKTLISYRPFEGNVNPTRNSA